MQMFDGLGRALRWLRENRRLRQFEVAKLAGITRPMLSAYETSKQRPTLETLDRILNALNCDLGELFEALSLMSPQPTGAFRRMPPTPESGVASPTLPTSSELRFLQRALEGREAADSEEEQAFAELLRVVYRWLLSVRREALRPAE